MHKVLCESNQFKEDFVDTTKYLKDSNTYAFMEQVAEHKTTAPPVYRYFTDKGNNSTLISSLMKGRPWWKFSSSDKLDTTDKVNFIWTQWKKNSILD